MRVSGNAINILGGHEDALHFNPEQHVLPNATYANTGDELVSVIRQQIKDGADFIKIYQTGRAFFKDGQFHTIVQYSEPQLAQAVAETARLQTRVAVHCEGEPAALYAAQAGVASIDHADQLSDETMRLMREKQIYAVPTFTIQEYFASHASSPEAAAEEHRLLDYHVQQFHRQLEHGVPMAVGSDVGPFPHGTQARELELMVEYGMKPLDVLKADLLNGSRLLDWEHNLGALKAGYYADIIAVPGNPLEDIRVLEHVSFVMKGGAIYRR
jgi:imidazolonepropionase-like amidohydrolase